MERFTGSILFAVGGLDLAIMSVRSRFASRFVSWAQNFGFCILIRQDVQQNISVGVR